MKFLLFILLINCSFLYSQDSTSVDSTKLNLSNSVSMMYIYNNNSPLFNFSYSGDNTIEKKHLRLSTNTNYAYQYNIIPLSLEWQQKSNLGYKNLFILHVFNYSLVRDIPIDNSIGIGYSKKWKYGSISYASIYQRTRYYGDPSLIESVRHSVRLKLKYEIPSTSILFEYYFQPNVQTIKDIIVYGNVKLSLFNTRKLNLTISDVLNYRSVSNVKTIHTLILGIGFNFKK